MNPLLKIMLSIVFALFVLGAAGAVFTVATVVSAVRAVEATPERADQVADQIVDFTLPVGYGSPAVVDMAGFKLVAFTGADDHSHLMLGQLRPGVRLDAPTLEDRIRDAHGYRWNDRPRMAIVGSMPAVIRGQAVTLAIAEGLNHDGDLYRDLFGVFEGKGGQAAVLISGPVSTWDHDTVGAILVSLQ